MKHTVCFIDDKIPVAQIEYFDDTSVINESVLQYLLKNTEIEWEDSSVKRMCQTLMNNRDKWSISAFTAPSFFDNHVYSAIGVPDVIIYDWDYNYAIGANDSIDLLKRILNDTFALVFIFSENDNTDEIKTCLKDKEIAKYKSRLGVVIKNNQRSVNALLKKIEKKYTENFSLNFGQEIICKSNKAISRVLAEISSFSVEEFVLSIGELRDNSYVSTNQDFLNVVLPRYRNQLCNNFPLKELPISTKEEPKVENLKKIWSFRLYDTNSSNCVSRGDIIRKNKGGYYLVASSDCHMNKFWKKNGGYLSLIPLKQIRKKQSKEILEMMGVKDVTFHSLTSSSISATILPALPISTSKFQDFAVFPKSIISINIPKPSGVKAEKTPLTYDQLQQYTKVTTISEPFKSPLMQFIIENISGYGCPDFPQKFKEHLRKITK